MTLTINKKTAEQDIQEDQYSFPYHYLSLYDERYRRFLHRHYLSLLNMVREMADVQPGQSVLDAGCGDGRFCFETRNLKLNLTGIDYSDRAIGFARAFNPTTNFIAGELGQVAFERPFDRVVCIEVFEHIPINALQDFIDGIVASTRSQGLITVSVPSTVLPVAKKHFQHFTPTSLTQLFSGTAELLKMVGHVDGRQWRRYTRMQNIASALWPIRNRMPLAHFYLNRFDRFFEKIRVVEPEFGLSIVAVFRKR